MGIKFRGENKIGALIRENQNLNLLDCFLWLCGLVKAEMHENNFYE